MDKIGKIIKKSKKGSQYTLSIKDNLELSYEDRNANFQINNFVFGQYEPEQNNRRPVFNNARLFNPVEEEDWITAFSISDNNVFDPLLSDLVNTYSSKLYKILQNGNENLNILFLHWSLQDEKVHDHISLGIGALNALRNDNIRDKKRVLYLSTVISFIINAWDFQEFADVRNQYFRPSKIDQIIDNAKDELNKLKETKVILSQFYALRINATKNMEDVKRILQNTPAIYFIKNDSSYNNNLSLESINILNSIYNTQTRLNIEDLITNNNHTIEQLGQYVLQHPNEWNDYSQNNAMAFLEVQSLSKLKNFIEMTHKIASEKWKNIYSSLLLSSQEALDDEILSLLSIIIPGNTEICPNIQYDNVKIIGNYICSNAANNKKLRDIVIKELQKKSIHFSWKELLSYSKNGLLNEKKLQYAAKTLSNEDLFTVYSQAVQQKIPQLQKVVKDILIQREMSWSDWTSGNELFNQCVFSSRPIRLLFSQQQQEREIVSEQSQLEKIPKQDLFNLLPEILDFLNNTSDKNRKAQLYWTCVKDVVFVNPSDYTASEEEIEDFREKYSLEDEETIILRLLGDLSANREITLTCLKQILCEVNNEETATAIATFINEKQLHSRSVIDRFINDHHCIFEDLTVARNLHFDVLIHDSAIKQLYCDGAIESAVRDRITANNINYWDNFKRKVLCEQSVPLASKKEMDDFREKYSEVESEIIPCLIEDLATNPQSTQSCLKSVLLFANNEDLAQRIKGFFNGDSYLSQRDANPFIKDVQGYSDNINLARRLKIDDLLPQNIRNLYDLESLRKENNDIYLQKHLKDSIKVGEKELIEEQKRAVLTDEDNTLVINSAGGGKTTLIEAKVRYLVEKKKWDSKRILVMSFNRSIAVELQKTLKDLGVVADTFHGIAQAIITRKDGYAPTYFEDKEAEAVFNDLLEKNDYKRIVLDYVLSNSYQGLSAPYDYENENQYNSAIIDYNKKNRKTHLDKLFANYKDKNGNTVSCKSIEECRICDFLGSHGIPFQYEKEYLNKNGEKVNGPGKRHYRPDFTLFNPNTGEVVLYLEHQGINNEGRCAPWIDLNEYKETKNWAEDIHRNNNDIYITTTSADFQNGNIFSDLSNKLEKYYDLNTIIAPQYRILQNGDVGKMCVSFVSLLKSSCQSLDQIIKTKKTSVEDKYYLEKMIKPFIKECEEKKNNDNKIDFDDAIARATKICNTDINEKRYDYILVDEFQDISKARYCFVKSLRNTNTKLFCVGDDWQSIYRFAGSDISLFEEFKNLTLDDGGYKEITAGTTFRFGDPIISVSSNFIIKNPAQKKKCVKPFIKTQTDLHVCKYNEDSQASDQIASILDSIYSDNDNSRDNERIPKVIFLARNNPRMSNAFKYLKINGLSVLSKEDHYYIKYKDQTIPFYSIHAAKGMQAQYVIVLNCNSGKYGIPSTVTDSHLLQYVLHKPDDYPYTEERRLFYVSLTRSIKKTWLLCDNSRPSPFIEEIEEIKSGLKNESDSDGIDVPPTAE